MISHALLDENVGVRVSDALTDALGRLQTAPYLPIRKTICDCEHGVLTLHGEVDSYYQKQVAQELVRNIDGIRQVVNDIEVNTAGDCCPARDA